MENNPLDNNSKIARLISDILLLNGKPIAIKFIKANEINLEISDEFNQKLRYCQLLMEAKYGKSGFLNSENITCPAASAAFGFKPLPEKINKLFLNNSDSG